MKEQTDTIAKERIDQLYQEVWKDELVEVIKGDAVMKLVDDKIESAVQLGLESVKAMVRTQFDAARTELTNYTYSKDETDQQFHTRQVSEAEARHKDVTELRRLITDLKTTATSTKGDNDNLFRSLQSSITRVDESLETLQGEDKSIRDSILTQRADLDRRCDDEAEVTKKSSQELSQKVEELASKLTGETQNRQIFQQMEQEKRNSISTQIDNNLLAFQNFADESKRLMKENDEKVVKLSNDGQVQTEMRKDLEDRMQKTLDGRFQDVGDQIFSTKTRIEEVARVADSATSQHLVVESALEKNDSGIKGVQEELTKIHSRWIQKLST